MLINTPLYFASQLLQLVIGFGGSVYVYFAYYHDMRLRDGDGDVIRMADHAADRQSTIY